MSPDDLKKARRFQARLRRRVRNRVNSALRPYLDGVADRGRDEGLRRVVGCSVTELVHHLESQFDDDMIWGNWGVQGWHIDHIMPLAAFDLTNADQRRSACHYTNLQPMWGDKNIQKGATIVKE